MNPNLRPCDVSNVLNSNCLYDGGAETQFGDASISTIIMVWCCFGVAVVNIKHIKTISDDIFQLFDL